MCLDSQLNLENWNGFNGDEIHWINNQQINSFVFPLYEVHATGCSFQFEECNREERNRRATEVKYRNVTNYYLDIPPYLSGIPGDAWLN